jgi:tetratricopeptide (TPR) repeat protein
MKLYILIVLGFLFATRVYAENDQVRLIDCDETEYKQTHSREASIMFKSGSEELLKNQRPDLAIIYFQKAIKADPRYVEALDNLAICYRRVGDYVKSELYYKRSMEIYPKGECAIGNLAIVYRAEGKKNEAMNMYKYMKEVLPENPEGYYGSAIGYWEMGDFNNAIENAIMALEKYRKKGDPICIDAEILISKIYNSKGDDQKSQYWRKEAEKDKIKYKVNL